MIIMSSKTGRLGNRLFLFAHFIAFAIEKGVTIVNPAFDEYADFFQTTADDFFCRFPPRKSVLNGTRIGRKLLYDITYHLKYYLDKWHINNGYIRTMTRDGVIKEVGEYSLDNPEFLGIINDCRVLFVSGWLFRDRGNFIKHSDKIRAYFKPLERHERNVNACISDLRKKNDIIIGVHIRHGDFRKSRWYYETGEYMRIMEKCKTVFQDKKTGFLICSDEKFEEGIFSRFNFAFGTGNIIEDMYSLAKCDYIISSASTFAAWASFYGKAPLYRMEKTGEDITIDSFKAVTS